MVTATPLGGAREIGASSLWIEAADLGVVVDFGARPGVIGEEAYPDMRPILGSSVQPAAVIVTHGHHDHVGGLPIFHREFSDVPVFATTPTLRIARTLLNDSLHIMETDANRAPEYSAEDVSSLLRVVVPVEMNEPRLVASSDRTAVIARFTHAGHILGAAVVTLDFIDLVKQRVSRIVVSGDVSAFDQPTIKGTDYEALRDLNPDLLLLEGTYGDSEHPPQPLQEAQFVKAVADAVREGGRVAIPAFATGRSQNIMVLLRQAIEDPTPFRKALGDPAFTFPAVPVYVDGMCRSIAEHYDSFRGMLHPDLRRVSRAARHVFFDDAGIVRSVRSAAERNEIAYSDEAWIVIASSGMMTGGAIITYAKAIANDPDASVFLVGYQDEESPGAVLQRLVGRRGKPARIRLGEEVVDFRAKAFKYGLSAHSDARDLEKLCETSVPEKVRLVHGDETALGALTTRLRGHLRSLKMRADVEVATIGVPIEVGDLAVRDRPDVIQTIAHPSISNRSSAARLTGLLAMGKGAPTGSTRAVSATLRHGWGIGLSASEAARLDALVDDSSPLDAGQVERTSSLLEAEQGASWSKRGSARSGWVFAPKIERTGRSFKDRSRHLEPVRTRTGRGDGSSGVPVSPGELAIIFAEGRLHPAAVLDPSGDELRVLSALGRHRVARNSVFARVGSWPFPGGGDDTREIRLLRTLSDLLQAHEREQVEDWTGAPADPNRERDRLWEEVSAGRLAMPHVAVGIQLLTLPSIFEGVSLDALLESLGASQDGLDDATIDALDALAECGLLKTRVDAEQMVLQWGGQGQTQRVGPSAADRMDELIGSGLGALLREAHDQALQTRRMRAKQEAQKASLDHDSAPTQKRSRKNVA